jgi:hypothetical protein
MTAVSQATPANQTEILAAHVAEIRHRGQRVVGDVIEIGRRLIECKRIVGHGNWLPWLKKEFDWSADTAERFIQVAKLSDQIPQIAEFKLPMSGLYLLGAPGVPTEVRTEVIEQAKGGATVTHEQIKEKIAKAKPPKPQRKRTEQTKQAARQAWRESYGLPPAATPRAPEAEDCPGGDPTKLAFTSLCFLVLAAGRDPQLADHLAALAGSQTPDPLPLTAIERVIALLANVAARMRVMEIPPAEISAASAPVAPTASDYPDMPGFLDRNKLN